MLQAMVLIAPISLPLQQIRYALRIKINQSLYRGTAFATQMLVTGIQQAFCFNPSIEGQPLQQQMQRWYF